MWSPLSSSKNAIVIEHVFTDVAVVFRKLSDTYTSAVGTIVGRDDNRVLWWEESISRRKKYDENVDIPAPGC